MLTREDVKLACVPIVADISKGGMPNPLYDVVLGKIPGVRDPGNPDPNWQPPTLKTTDSSVESFKDHGDTTKPNEYTPVLSAAKSPGLPTGGTAMADVTKGELKILQEQDRTLTECFQKQGKKFTSTAITSP